MMREPSWRDSKKKTNTRACLLNGFNAARRAAAALFAAMPMPGFSGRFPPVPAGVRLRPVSMPPSRCNAPPPNAYNAGCYTSSSKPLCAFNTTILFNFLMFLLIPAKSPFMVLREVA
jgi:hypothetical protein